MARGPRGPGRLQPAPVPRLGTGVPCHLVCEAQASRFCTPGSAGPPQDSGSWWLLADGGGSWEGEPPRAAVVTVVLPIRPHRRGLRGWGAAPTRAPGVPEDEALLDVAGCFCIPVPALTWGEKEGRELSSGKDVSGGRRPRPTSRVCPGKPGQANTLGENPLLVPQHRRTCDTRQCGWRSDSGMSPLLSCPALRTPRAYDCDRYFLG